MAGSILRKKYKNQFGLDLKSSDLDRPEVFASGMLNAEYRKSGAPQSRRGYEGNAASSGGHGLFEYRRIDPSTNIETPEVLSVSNVLHKKEVSTLTVTYSGASLTVMISIFFDPDTSQYRCQILESTTLVLDEPLGVGFDEASIKTIDSLRSDIDALTGFSASVSGATSTPAAFIKTVRSHDLVLESYIGQASYWSDVNTTISAPFGGSETNKNTDSFENATAVQLQNIIYISNGYDEVQKYDGQTVYRAGLPNIASLTSALGGAGAITGTTYFHKARYIQKDAVGNFIEGNLEVTSAGLSPAAQSMDVTVSDVQAGSGFNTNCAIVAGAQVTVNTITVDDGSGGSHTMNVGDTAYFFDSVSGGYVEREVTATAASTITVDGAAVTVADNAVISNNLRIEISRTLTGGSATGIFFLVEEIPNDSFSTTQIFNDNITDAGLGAQIIEPLTDRSPPPKGRYISSFRGQMVIGGKIDDPNNAFYSDIDGVEYFPAGSNSFFADSGKGDIISGIAPNNEVFCIFLDRSIAVVSGNIADGNIRVDFLQGDIGCIAHASIKDIKGSLFFLSDRGPFKMTGGQLPEPLGGGRIEPAFDGNLMTLEIKQELFGTQDITDEQRFQLKRSVGFNDRAGQKYWLYVPCETTTSGDVHANTNSKIFAYDYAEVMIDGVSRVRDAWLLWDNINAAGGIVSSEGEIYWQERRYSSFNTSVDHILYRRHNLGDSYDFEDNISAIIWRYDQSWEAAGEPSILKRFLRLRIFELEETLNNELLLDVNLETNYVRDQATGTFQLDLGGEGYGVSAYGTAPYGDPAQPATNHKLNLGRCRSMRVRYSNSEHQQNVILSGWEIEAAVPFMPGIKS